MTAAHDFDWSRVRAGLVRLVTLAAAAFALLSTVMLPQLVDGSESAWVLTAWSFGMCLASAATVVLTASVAVQQVVAALSGGES
jgi:hypothetical protein